MLRINPIKNVNYTLNRNISFGQGVQTNYGMDVPSPSDNMVEGGLFTGFVGTLATLFSNTKNRAQSIENGLEEVRLNMTA